MACGIQKRGAVNRNKVVAISYVIAIISIQTCAKE